MKNWSLTTFVFKEVFVSPLTPYYQINQQHLKHCVSRTGTDHNYFMKSDRVLVYFRLKHKI